MGEFFSKKATRIIQILRSHLIAGFFEPSIQCIEDAVVKQRRCATKPVSVGIPLIIIRHSKGNLCNDRLFSLLGDSLQAITCSTNFNKDLDHKALRFADRILMC
jgi:hypothetical protein